MAKVAVSLQQRLIKSAMLSSICAGGVALILLIAFSVYQTMTTQDDIMDEVSDMLLVSDLSAGAGRQVDELSDEFNIAYQLKFNQQVLTQSEHFVATDLTHSEQAPEGRFSIVWQDSSPIRRYQYDDLDRQLHVQLDQPLSERFSDFFQSFLVYALCLMLLWLLQWLLLHFAVKKQFRAIQRLSQSIAQKNADDLSPIDSQSEFVELQPMLQQLNLLLQRVQQSLIAEQRFTADASHELRSPLSAIQMRLQLIKRKYADQSLGAAQDLEQIQHDVSRGTQVLENLLLLARLDPTDLSQLPKQSFDFSDLIAELLHSFEHAAQHKQIQIHLTRLKPNSHQEHDPQQQKNSACMVVANRELIFICIRNLVDNAIRYAQPNGNIYIEYGRLDAAVGIIIEDDGQQLTAEVLARLGERFYRALGTKTQGSGLGLSICKKIIQLHQGQIAFTTSAHAGLKVELYLPA